MLRKAETMKFIKVLAAVIAALAMLIISGCGSNDSEQVNAGSYTVTDDAGRTITLNGKPQRIVSLTYGTDEILYELVGASRLIALSRWAGDQDISFISKADADKIGRRVYENTEEIYGLKPDLIVASVATNEEVVRTLENMGLKVYVARSPKNYDEMKQKITGIAAAVGEEQRGQAMTQKMDEDMAALEKRLSGITGDKRKIVIAFNFTAAMGRKGDLFDDMLNRAHIINGAVLGGSGAELKHGNAPVSKEQIVAIDPDVFLLPTWNYNKKQNVEAYAEQIADDPAYKNVKAIKNKQLKFVSDKYRYVSSQHITEAVAALAKAVYPEAFREDGQ